MFLSLFNFKLHRSCVIEKIRRWLFLPNDKPDIIQVMGYTEGFGKSVCHLSCRGENLSLAEHYRSFVTTDRAT